MSGLSRPVSGGRLAAQRDHFSVITQKVNNLPSIGLQPMRELENKPAS
jgi:hypothetical protein